MQKSIQPYIDDSKYEIRKIDSNIIICGKNSGYPEDYLMIERKPDSMISLSKVNRDSKREVFSSKNENAVVVYTVMLYKKEMTSLGDENFRDELREYVDNNSIEDSVTLLQSKADIDYFSIGVSAYDKISLVINGEKGDVLYHDKPLDLVTNAPIRRCFVVVYNLSCDLKDFHDYYESLSDEQKNSVDYDELTDYLIHG